MSLARVAVTLGAYLAGQALLLVGLGRLGIGILRMVVAQRSFNFHLTSSVVLIALGIAVGICGALIVP